MLLFWQQKEYISEEAHILFYFNCLCFPNCKKNSMMIFLQADKYFSVDFLLEKNIQVKGTRLAGLCLVYTKLLFPLKNLAVASISVSPSKCIC